MLSDSTSPERIHTNLTAPTSRTCNIESSLEAADMVPLLAAIVIASTPSKAAQKPGDSCAAVREFVGTAPSDIVQQKYAAHFDQPLNRIDCRDNGLCYQTWGKDCSQATK